MEPAVANLYETDRDSFNRKATEWTYKYAMADILSLNLDEDPDDPLVLIVFENKEIWALESN